MVPEISSAHVVHDEVEVVPILEGVEHINEEGVFELAEKLAFVHDGGDGFFGDDETFGHLLHGEGFFFLTRLDLPDFSESSLSNDVVEIELVFGDE